MNDLADNPRSSPDDLACLAAPNPTLHTTEEPETPFPTLALMSVMLLFFIAAILSNSIVMLISALLPTPLLLWRLFVTLDEWEVRRAAARKLNAATSTTKTAADQPSGTTPTTNQIERP